MTGASGGASTPGRPSEKRTEPVIIYTDGACSGNPGPGGWGVWMSFDGHEKSLHGADAQTTNNRMELMAAIQALEHLKRPCRVRLHTDSTYVRNGITQWLAGWKRKGWRSASGSPVKNQDLWQRLDEATDGHDIDWVWVKGHSGVAGNEKADELARLAIKEMEPSVSL